MKFYNHMLDVAFTINSSSENWYDISIEDIINALQARVDYLRNNPQEASDAFGYSDSFEIE